MGSYYSATRGRLSDASLRFETDANHAGFWNFDARTESGGRLLRPDLSDGIGNPVPTPPIDPILTVSRGRED